MTNENEAREDEEREDDEREDDEHEAEAEADDDESPSESATVAAPARKPAPTPVFPDDALHAAFEASRKEDLDAIPAREAAKWFTYTVVGIAVYGAVVIYFIYL